MDIIIIILLLIIAAEVTYLLKTMRRKNQSIKQAPIFIDTSVLIDGRIVAVAESGFVSRPLYIPRSVVGELQFLADNGDTEKRTRARHGLDVIKQLQSVDSVEVVIFTDSVRAEEGVDNRLLKLSEEHNGSLCTIDYNLNKVAAVQGIQVLNVNELTKSLRMAYLPGEKVMIELSQKGNDSRQAVGHLSDGTMVVVENSSKYMGKTVEVEFVRALQTAAGKMMFAKLSGKTTQEKPAKVAAPVRSQPKTDARASKASPKGKSPVVPRPNNRRRKSPEDSLVELANS